MARRSTGPRRNPLLPQESDRGKDLHTDTYGRTNVASTNLMTLDSDSTDPEFLTVEDVAARLKVKEKTVRDWIGRGMLEAYKIGKVWRIRKDHLDQAMEARRVS